MIKLNVPYFNEDERQAVEDCLSSGNLSQGEKVEEFEEKVRKYVGAKYAVAVSSCTAGLYLALKLRGRTYSNDPLVPAFTFPAVQNAMLSVDEKARILDVDVEKETYNMDTNDLVKVITKSKPDKRSFSLISLNTIIPIHQFGLPCDMDKINEIAKENELFVLEDAACALGSEYKGEKIGRRGTAVFSFHGRKIITTGEGGMVVTDDEELYEKVLEGRQYGRNRYGDFVSSGLNFKLSDVAASIGIAQMDKLDEILRNRSFVAERYNELLYPFEEYELLHYSSGLNRPSYADYLWSDTKTNWQSYVIRGVRNRDEVMRKMRAAGIECTLGSYDNSNGRCKVSQELSKTTLALPCWSAPMPEETIEKVVEELGRCLKS